MSARQPHGSAGGVERILCATTNEAGVASWGRVTWNGGPQEVLPPCPSKPNRCSVPTFSARIWEAWQDELSSVRLLDPACGSGAFLIEAFDQLHASYHASNDRLEELRGHRTLFNLDKRILENNLYGVDLNEEAIEICRLSLWIKTAERGKALTSLDHTIRVGNSIVADSAVDPRAFDWQAAFPGVFSPRPHRGSRAEGETSGGFDVVVANPPYIRQEWLGASHLRLLGSVLSPENPVA